MMATSTRSSSCLTFASLNCDGVRRNVDYVKHVCDSLKPHILCLQETWVFECNDHFLASIHDDYSYICNSAATPIDRYIAGHAPGGVAILTRTGLKNVRIVKTDSKRLCALTFDDHNVHFLIVNVYMPVDSQIIRCNEVMYHDDNDDDSNSFDVVINEIELLIESVVCDHVIVCGDFNAAFERNNVQSNSLMEFITLNNLCVGWDAPNTAVVPTYVNTSLNHSSRIDHFIVDCCIFDNIQCHEVTFDPMNLSSHALLVLGVNISHLDRAAPRPLRKPSKKTMWAKASYAEKAAYKDQVTALIECLPVDVEAVNCQDTQCNSAAHRESINDLCNNLINCCLLAEQGSIRQPRLGRKPIPGWSTEVRMLREDALYWHRVWEDHGRAMAGHAYDTMKQTRAAYHYAIRHCRRNEAHFRKIKLAQAVVADPREFWDKVKRINSAKSTLPTSVDDAADSDSIAELFAQKYERVFQSVATSEEEMHALTTRIASAVLSDGIYAAPQVLTSDDVTRAVKMLKVGKSDGKGEFYSDHLKHSGPCLHMALSVLFNSMLVHGYTPDALLSSFVVSIPKNLRASLSSSDNYRGISLCIAISKLLELVILLRWRPLFMSSDLQFGYKVSHSTSMCSAIYREIVQYFTCRKSKVYSVLLDASKAFDKVHFGKLFNLLLDRGIPPAVVRVLLDNYTRQTLATQWGFSRSDPFNVLNGVKQGGILSPILFTLYVDELLNRLRNCNCGCYFQNVFAGALCYADDITLISPSLRGLNVMVSTCERFAEEFYLTFNAKKSVAIYYGCRDRPAGSVALNNESIPWSTKCVHLGHVITNDLKFDSDVSAKISSFVSSVNRLIGNFGNNHYATLRRLFNAYCSCFYGSQLWLVDSRNEARAGVAWNKAVRRVFALPRRSHTRLLGPLLGQPHLTKQIHSRVFKFCKSLLDVNNILVNTIARKQFFDARSSIGHNIARLRELYSVSPLFHNYDYARSIIYDARLSEFDAWQSNFLIELILGREGTLHIPLDCEQIDIMIEYIACN